jgi:tripartite-type tricarboxylate transporter receptor subunit TctC
MMTRCGLAIAALLLMAGTAAAEEPVSFKGRTVTMIIGFAAGGGTDYAGRLIASSIGKYLPGEPNVVAQNVPGADGMTALNFFVQQVKRDGLTITMGSGSQSDPMHYRKPQSKYDPSTFAFVGGAGRGGTVLVIGKDAQKRLHDAAATPVVMGSLSGMPRSGMQMTAWGKEFLGWNAKWVVGYRGTSSLLVALERGEIDMTSTANLGHVNRLLATGKFALEAQTGTYKGGKFEMRPDFGGAPLMTAMLEGRIKDKVAAQAFRYWALLTTADKWLALPPGTPEPIVATYRAAFARMVEDPEFLARGKAMAEDLEPQNYADVERIMRGLGETPPAATTYIVDMLRRQGVKVE